MKKILVAVALFVAGCSDTSTNTTYTPSNSSEYNYAKNRFKAEGYSTKDSETAAKAVMKFHEAQKRRKSGY